MVSDVKDSVSKQRVHTRGLTYWQTEAVEKCGAKNFETLPQFPIFRHTSFDNLSTNIGRACQSSHQ